MSDARFEDAAAALALRALDEDDLAVVSSLVQDAVFPITEMTWQKRRRRFAILLNRFRWEDRVAAESSGRPYERTQSLLVVQDVLALRMPGLVDCDRDTVLSLLSLHFVPGPETTGRLELVLAGDAAIALDVECLDVALKDVSRPYRAPSGTAPQHPETE